MSIWKFYGILDSRSKLLIGFAWLSALIAGMLFPSFAVVMGSSLGAISSLQPGKTPTNLNETFQGILIPCAIISALIWLFGFLYYFIFKKISEEITNSLRARYLKALMKQEVTYFELNDVETMPSDVGVFFSTISVGIGESLGTLLQTIGTLIGGIIIAFVRGPVFAMVCIGFTPIILIFVIVFGSLSRKAAFTKMANTKQLSGFTEESLSALKLIVAFN